MQNWHYAYIAETCRFLQYLVLFCPLKIGSHCVLPEGLCRTYISSFPFYILPFVFVFDKDGVSILLGSCARQGGETPGSDLSDGRQAEKLYITLLCCYDLFFVSIVFLLFSLLYLVFCWILGIHGNVCLVAVLLGVFFGVISYLFIYFSLVCILYIVQ